MLSTWKYIRCNVPTPFNQGKDKALKKFLGYLVQIRSQRSWSVCKDMVAPTLGNMEVPQS